MRRRAPAPGRPGGGARDGRGPRRSTFPAAARACVLAAVAAALAPPALHAQHADAAAGLFVGSEAERYLRVLQGRGAVPAHPWSVRGFSRAEAERLLPADSLHPWGEWIGRRDGSPPRFELRLLPAGAALRFNSAFPYGHAEGPVWAGRGLTVSAEAGVAVRVGPVSAVVAPVAYHSANAAFPLAPHSFEGLSVFADPRRPDRIDLPQRFGDGAFTRLDWGQSTVRVDLAGLAAGLSTANQAWGPAIAYPLILGNDAPGFVHAFAGTARPVSIGVGRLHGRVIWGRLEQSEFSPMEGLGSTRFATGLVVAFAPRWLDGLEVGGSRFYHLTWQGRDYLKVFDQPLRGDRSRNPGRGRGMDNQLASVFARWVLPRSGFEAYAEFAREDFNIEFRDLVVEPDHASAYALGFQKSWPVAGGRLGVVRGEVMNASRSHLDHVRNQFPFHQHAQLRQGHTHRGRTLGDRAVYGGAGVTLATDLYHAGGRWTLQWSRELRRELGEGPVPPDPTGDYDVLHALRAEALVLLGQVHLTGALNGVHNLNRDFRGDVFNLNLVLSARAALH